MEAGGCPVPVRPLRDPLPLLRRESFPPSLPQPPDWRRSRPWCALQAQRTGNEAAFVSVPVSQMERLRLGEGQGASSHPCLVPLCSAVPAQHPHPTPGQLDGANSDEDSTSSDGAPPALRGRCQLPEVALALTGQEGGPWPLPALGSSMAVTPTAPSNVTVASTQGGTQWSGRVMQGVLLLCLEPVKAHTPGKLLRGLLEATLR